MPRKSVASFSVVPPSLPGPPLVPSDFDAPHAAIWRGVVESKPSGWFGADCQPLLREYCRAAVMCDVLAPVVADAMAGDDARLQRRLIDIRDKESKRAALLATKLRLTPQARYGPRRAFSEDRKASGPRPWDRE